MPPRKCLERGITASVGNEAYPTILDQYDNGGTELKWMGNRDQASALTLLHKA